MLLSPIATGLLCCQWNGIYGAACEASSEKFSMKKTADKFLLDFSSPKGKAAEIRVLEDAEDGT